jgi:DNA-binding transcriptional regulator YbjK
MSSPDRATRRKPPDERRAEIIETASAIALAEGLDKVTARRVADALGVFPGLVNHYFRTADALRSTTPPPASTTRCSGTPRRPPPRSSSFSECWTVG